MEQEITIREFRMWLAGVEEMQPSNWVPDDRQWAIIRNKIDSVMDTPQVQPVAQPIVASPVTTIPPEPIYRDPTIPVSHAASGLSMVQPVQPAHNAALFANADNPTAPVRTPNVDTSTGGYNSAFE
jgi:hypothetical protein